MRKRTNQIKFRMNDEEYAALQKKITASGQSQQSFILSALAGAVIAPKEEIELLKECNCNFADLVRQIKGMATNINQIAHIANGSGTLPTQYKLSDIGIEIEKFRGEIEKEWLSIRQLISQLNHMGQ